MDFDYDGEFDRIMEEISPMSIPAHFVKQVVVKMKNGQEITLSGEELLQPLPMVENVGWNQLAKRFDKIDDVEVQIDVPAIKQNVVLNVKNILKAHFEQNKDD
jgi:DNA/RNA endonuclease G (NUC1)